ncbi:MAG: hypothetical protein IKK34_12715 [Clostridia bacterium]|nr:hypothetical protein [Clostridia bacterium]
MYSFQANAGRKKSRQKIRLLAVIIFILTLALIGVTVSYLRTRGISEATSEALMSRVLSEASGAQSAVYRLTQSSGTNTMTLLSTVRSHIYAIQSINNIAANIYGAGTSLADGELLSACIQTITDIESRMQAGSVLTTLQTQLRDQVDQVVASFGGAI